MGLGLACPPAVTSRAVSLGHNGKASRPWKVREARWESGVPAATGLVLRKGRASGCSAPPTPRIEISLPHHTMLRVRQEGQRVGVLPVES